MGGTHPRAQRPEFVGDWGSTSQISGAAPSPTQLLCGKQGWQGTSRKFPTVGGRRLTTDGLWPCSVASCILRASGKEGGRRGWGVITSWASRSGPRGACWEEARGRAAGEQRRPGGPKLKCGPGLAYLANAGAAQSQRGGARAER